MKKKIKIAHKFIGKQNSCFIVAEAGCNHNGSLELGKKLIESAKECGCDAVKFQAFRTENLVTKNADKAPYQKGKSRGRNQFEMLKALELSDGQHRELIRHANNLGIFIFYSVFDAESADFIADLGVNIFKLGSGELTNIPLIKYIAKKKKPLILSTGMASDEEIQAAVNAFKGEENEQLILMNCSTGYPCRLEDVNLNRIKYLEDKFVVFCGNSDHTHGITVSIVAAVMGSAIIEKHFTLDKKLPGPDHAMSIEPEEMRQLCSAVRILEKHPIRQNGLIGFLKKLGIFMTKGQLKRVLGRKDRALSAVEESHRIWARKSIIGARDIKKGKRICIGDLAIKRPEVGILPKDYDRVMARQARVFIKSQTPLQWEMLT